MTVKKSYRSRVPRRSANEYKKKKLLLKLFTEYVEIVLVMTHFAMRAALLMLPDRFNEEDLFLKIAGLSYRGDFRMVFGENPHKVFNIVYAQMEAFKAKYSPVIHDLPNINYLSDGTLEVL